MTASKWHLIRDLAEKSGVPESTARRYARLFPEYMPAKSFGRIKKYPAESARVIALIHDCYRRGMTTAEVAENLKDHAPRVIELEPGEGGHKVPVSQEFASPVDMGSVLAGIFEALKSISAQAEIKKEVEDIRRAVSVLWKEFESRKGLPPGAEAAQKLNEQDEKIEGLLRELQDQARVIDELKGQREDYQKKMEVLEAELVRLRKDGRMTEKMLLEKIKAVRSAGEND